MTHLFSPEADHVIDEILTHTPLLALDFDGTLAPIVALPEQARAPMAVSRVLARISEFLPVAIITGRSIADVSERLGFVPHYIVGNHGAEGLPDSEITDTAHLVAQWRSTLDHTFGPKLKAAGITVEDKGHSLSLHYRLARDRKPAMDAIRSIVAALRPAPRVIEGKCVTNLLPHGAPDKFHAVRTLARLAQCDTVIFAGDDVVFEQAPPN